MSPTILTGTESRRLETIEAVIRRGQKTFVEIGAALATIRDERLYRSDFSTFQEYCKERWSWDSNYARRLISAAEVVQSVPIGTVSSESQARELAKVEHSKREEVLAKAAESGSVTAKSIKAAATPVPEPESKVEAAPVIEVQAAEVPAFEFSNPWASRIYQLANDIADDSNPATKAEAIALLQQQVEWLNGEGAR